MATRKLEIYKTLTFGGDKCDILVPYLKDFSAIYQAKEEYNLVISKKEKLEEDDVTLDLTPFFVQRCCRFNGKKQTLPFVLKLPSHVYFKINKAITEFIESIEGIE